MFTLFLNGKGSFTTPRLSDAEKAHNEMIEREVRRQKLRTELLRLIADYLKKESVSYDNLIISAFTIENGFEKNLSVCLDKDTFH